MFEGDQAVRAHQSSSFIPHSPSQFDFRSSNPCRHHYFRSLLCTALPRVHRRRRDYYLGPLAFGGNRLTKRHLFTPLRTILALPSSSLHVLTTSPVNLFPLAILTIWEARREQSLIVSSRIFSLKWKKHEPSLHPKSSPQQTRVDDRALPFQIGLLVSHLSHSTTTPPPISYLN